MKIFYFTGTGNSLAVAKHIGGELVSIPQVVDSQNLEYQDDIIGVVFPIYSLNFPKMVKRFLEKAVFKADYIFLIVTCGGGVGKTLREAQEMAVQNGYSFDYLAKMNMVDNCLPQWEMDTERKKAEKKDIDGQLERIKNAIENRKKTEEIPIPGGRLLCWFSRKYFPIPDDFHKKYIIDDKCNQCGTCAKVCAVANVIVNDKVSFGDYCEGCQACIHACPQKAIHLKMERSDKRWRNPDVLLSEIITANDRSKSIM